MITGDASYIKKINRSLIIREILREEMISRADLSKITALTRATISAQVADLLEEELVVETQLEHNSVGRKPIMLSLNGHAGYALGIDLDFGQVSFTLSNLLGSPVSSEIIRIHTNNYAEILELLILNITKYQKEFSDSRYGIVGIVVAIHGLVSNDEFIQYVPRFHWKNVNLKSDLEKAVGVEIHLENNANLSSFAERVFIHHETDNLLCTTLYSGIGLGMMMNNKFFRGHDGFAGEIGHMIIVPGGKPCTCGNKGCWEKYASETSVFEYLSETKSISNITYEQIQQWMNEDDSDVYEIMEQFIYYLSIGLNNMINIYNPDVVVIDSELLRIYPDSLHKIHQNLHSQISHYRELTLSTIGKKSCVLGACALAISHFLDVPILNLPYKD
ncbi:ROK family transcriptional regulator [Paenibacillus dokdonensis]|uniref:ROK family transcriptional regulator n=1 Tax=Paenibacillus dokdonensis TaxID=2567944 RepID=A0ABU6GHY2_9BACL|nr:ROK family transcriptional regulator [Paenibacillus dokdonensis]MEC0239038.1 ROK family transcriptional regulator [Paenibacillus dokdonensis]